MRIVAIVLMLIVSLGASGCMKMTKSSDEVRAAVNAGNLGTDSESVEVNASLRTVVNRVAEKANNCLHYELTMTGSGTQIITYVPKLEKISNSKISMFVSTRYRSKSLFQKSDDSGVGFVADMEALSRNRTKVTTYSSLGFAGSFHEAVISAAKGDKKGACPAED